MKRGLENEKIAWYPVIMFLIFLTIPVLYVMFSLVASAASLSNTTTPKYYDDIKITYTLKNPNGGVWNTNGDIPIGRMGTSFGNISDYIYVNV